MNTIISEESNFQVDAARRTSFIAAPKAAKITGILCLVFMALSVAALFLPFMSSPLYWNFLLISAALGVIGFLETYSGKTWLGNIAWLVSLVLLIVLFLLAYDSFRNPQLIYFYGAFSIIVPVLLTITALVAKNAAVWKSLCPLLIPAISAVSFALLSPRSVYPSFIMLPISWGILGFLNYLGASENTKIERPKL